MYKLILCFLVLASCSLVVAAQATVKLKVLDEEGKPVPNADVVVIFKGMRWEMNGVVNAKTNADGLLEAKGWSKDDFLDGIEVYSESPDYYTSQLNVPLNLDAADLGDRAFDLQLLIRRKEKPIAMYAKMVELELPEQRKAIGFDFEKADWVKPYGKGEVADCTFIGEKKFEDDHKYGCTVVMSFVEGKAGMQPDPAQENKASQLSAFKTSRHAPAENYQLAREFVWSWSKKDGRKGSTKDANYIFRSRVVLDETGKIKSCHYGKMIEAVNVARKSGYPNGNPIVAFTYYFNPTPNDRNLEFDPKQNLFLSPDGNLEIWQP